MSASAAMTSSQVLPETFRRDTSVPGPWISRCPENNTSAGVMVTTKTRVCSAPLKSWKRPVRWRSARMKAVPSGHLGGAEYWIRMCSGSALARAGRPVAARSRSAIAPIRWQARMANISHLSSWASILGSRHSETSCREK